MGASLTAVIVSYGGRDEVLRCVRSVRETEPEAQVVVVENGAPAPPLQEAAARGELELVVPGRNLGFGGGCNLGARHARGDVLAFLNPDTVVAPGALAALAGALTDDSVGIATARVRLLDEPHLLNTGGNVLHLTGLAWVAGYRLPVHTAAAERDVAFPSGAAMAMRRDLFAELGGFREELFMYHEDVDLGWRVWMSGRRVVMTPAADVFHAYSFGRNPQKRYLLERNRLTFLLCDLPGRLLLLLAPVLLAAEVGLTLLAWREGWLREKARGWAWCARHARALRRRRRETQALRRVPVRLLAGLLSATVDPTVVDVPAPVRLANPLLGAYWALARRAA
jgi:GT2 family glycosyltransferase